ncbi:hypothetical protein [Ethanoligenens sp.]|uniref:hypothetical protein n=1 Tax=Ethanoligenens sp. TaxID=2099655 RepID=UPI0039E7B004
MPQKRKYTSKQGEWTAAYKKEHYSRIVMDVPTEEKERIKAAAEKAGESLQGFLVRSAEERIIRLRAK